MTGLPIDYNDPAVRDAFKRLGRAGGQSRSEAKRKAAQENQKKAVASRMAKRRGIVDDQR